MICTKTLRKAVTNFILADPLFIAPTLCNHQQPFALSILIQKRKPFHVQVLIVRYIRNFYEK